MLKGDFFVLSEKYAEKYCGKTVYIPADIVDVRGERGRDVVFFYHILADEPTAALDSATANEIMNVLQELNDRGKTIVLVTHDVNMANKMRRIVHIADGVIEEN